MAANNTLQKAADAQAAPVEQKAKQSINQLMNAMLDGEKLRGRFEELLGKRTPQFVSSMVTMINADANLQQAFYQAPMTVIQSCLKAASYDLPIDPSLGYAYIVPFNNTVKGDNGESFKRKEAQFIIGWKGMYQLAMRSAVYKKLNVSDVREGELVSYDRLTEDIVLEFVEDEDERKKLPVIGYVGYYRLINGMEKTIYMTRKQIENHERKNRKGQYMGKGWRDDWDAMARKTIYRALIGKYGVMSIDYRTSAEAAQLANAVVEDEGLYNGQAALEGSAYTGADYTVVDAETGEVLDGDTEPEQTVPEA